MESIHKKKILIFIDWYRPAHLAGGPIQSVFNMVNALEKDYFFYICTSNSDIGSGNELEGITPNKWLKSSSNSEVIYLSAENRTKKTFLSILKNQEFESIYFNSLFSFKFSLLPLFLAKKLNTVSKLILAPRGMLGSGSLKLKKTKKKSFLFIAKLIGLFKGITWHVSSELEKKEVTSAFGNSVNIHIAQNLPSQSENGHVKREKLKHELDLFYISRISEVKNLKHSLSILDHDFQGEITYNIYGPIEDEEYWEQCKSIISGLPKNINVTHHGSINPKDVQSTLNKHHFLFLTTQNENFGHSIVESFLSSKPVIISDRTPWLNLEEKEIGWDISMTDLKKFRNSIKQCLEMSQEEYDRWSENAFIFGNSTSKNKEALEYNRLLFSNNI